MATKKDRARGLLELLGYEIDGRGIVRASPYQPAFIALDVYEDEGVLKIYTGDSELEGALPFRLSSTYIYFRDGENEFKVPLQEFIRNMKKALFEYSQFIKGSFVGL